MQEVGEPAPLGLLGREQLIRQAKALGLALACLVPEPLDLLAVALSLQSVA